MTLPACSCDRYVILDSSEKRVDNDFTLANPGDLVLITGSNMSGKVRFTDTRSNLSLAYAGVVNARTFRWTATIRTVLDHGLLTDGISYFYAEVKRLKALLDALEQDHPFPLLFLIDEIFRGTNNRERLIGSRAYIRALGQQRGAGVLSTHDLELVTLADEMPQLRNAHFSEHIADGQMSFDYRLRSGPCPTTNALKIMQMEGLPVDSTAAVEE
jgi:DNA mismatch repair ATPase MutS